MHLPIAIFWCECDKLYSLFFYYVLFHFLQNFFTFHNDQFYIDWRDNLAIMTKTFISS